MYGCPNVLIQDAEAKYGIIFKTFFFFFFFSQISPNFEKNMINLNFLH